MNKRLDSSSAERSLASQFGAWMATAAVIALAVFIALGTVLSFLPYRVAHLAVKKDDVFSLSTASKSWLAGLDQDVTLYFVCSGGESHADPDLYAFLNRYADENDHITVKVVDPDADTGFFAAYGGEAPANMSVIVQGAARYRIVEYSDLHFYYFSDSSYGSMRLTPADYNDALEQLMEGDPSGASAMQFAAQITAYFDAETQLANAIEFVTRERIAKACLLSGNGYSEPDASFLAGLKQNYDLQSVASIEDLPANCDLLILNSPNKDLIESEADALSEYLERGGKLFLATSMQTGILENLNDVLAEYGLSYDTTTDKICEGDEDYVLQESGVSYPEIFYAHIDSAHAFSKDFTETFVAIYAHAIAVKETDGVTLTKWLHTSEKAYLKPESEDAEQGPEKESEGPTTSSYTFGAIAERGETRIVWIAAAYSLNSSVDSYAEGGNFG